MTVNIENRCQAKKIENFDNLSEKPLSGTIFEKNIFNFQESIVFEKMKKNENISRLYRGKIQSYKTEIFFFKRILSFLSN